MQAHVFNCCSMKYYFYTFSFIDLKVIKHTLFITGTTNESNSIEPRDQPSDQSNTIQA